MFNLLLSFLATVACIITGWFTKDPGWLLATAIWGVNLGFDLRQEAEKIED